MLSDDAFIEFNMGFVHSGWTDVLPQQAVALHALVAVASARDYDGSLDALVALAGPGWFDDSTGGLDAPVRWLHPDDGGDLDCEADAGTARDECGRAFDRARLEVPTTVRELGSTMAKLGILSFDQFIPRWRLASVLLLPEEVLPVSTALRQAQADRRWSALHEATALHLSRFLAAAGARHRALTTSVARLEAAIGHNEDGIRGALEVLVSYGVIVLTHTDGSGADPERLLAATPVVVANLDFEAYPAIH